jgi:hypothetical protein
MHKSATKCNETVGKWCKNKHGASKIIDTLEMYQDARQGDCFAGCLMKTKIAFSTVPKNSILTLSYPCGEILLLLQYYALGVPTKWHIA